MASTASRMLRLALTPRWLVGLLVLLLLVAGAVLLGRWQWDRTQSILVAERAAASAPVPVEEVFATEPGASAVPAENIGRPVTVSGRYDPQLQVAVSDRVHDGERGVWVVSGVELSDGSVAAVLRGSLPSTDAAGWVPPDGPVTVTGILHPDERFYADAVRESGVIASIARDRLAAEWDAPLLPGFVVLEQQEPSVSPAPEPVPPMVQTADVPFPLQNFFYAFQWWIFAAFGVVVYLRWLWIETRRPDDEEVVVSAV